MRIREDRRPTLASWPKRLYDWTELPEAFRPALEPWRAMGMPPGNATYIPRVHQYAGGEEYVTAWLGEEVMLLTDGPGGVAAFRARRGACAQVRYTVQLLECRVAAVMPWGGEAVTGTFRYNKTKEDQLFPVLDLLLDNAPDFRPRGTHPDTAALDRLREDSFAMYHTAKLCYRFGEEIRDYLWFRGRNSGLWHLGKQKPEYFLGKMDRGMVAIRTDFYGTEAVYFPSHYLRGVAVEAAGRQNALVLKAACGPDLTFPLLPGQEEAAENFLKVN